MRTNAALFSISGFPSTLTNLPATSNSESSVAMLVLSARFRPPPDCFIERPYHDSRRTSLCVLIFQVAPTLDVPSHIYVIIPFIISSSRAFVMACPDHDHYLRQHCSSLTPHSLRVTATLCLLLAGEVLMLLHFKLHWDPKSVPTYLWDCFQAIGPSLREAVLAAYQF
jgi:hypothetical protein